MQRVLTSVTLLGLLVATAAAFAITEHLKLKKSPLYAVQVSAGPHPAPSPATGRVSPVCHCPTSMARIGIRLRHPDRVTVTIVDSAGHTVATTGATAASWAPAAPQHFVWDGRTDSGALVPDGVYYPWVHLANARHTFKFANKITVDTQPPEVLSATGVEARPASPGPAARSRSSTTSTRRLTPSSTSATA